MMNDVLLQHLLKVEGGLTNDKVDRGGLTNLGITKSTFDQAKKDGIISSNVELDELTAFDALKIYDYYYYTPSKTYELNEPLDVLHLDAAVNHGVSRASKFLQEAIYIVLKPYFLKNNINFHIDGIIGPKTLKYYHKIAENKESLMLLYSIYINLRYRYYNEIVANDKTQLKFLHGWLNRLKIFVDKLRQYCLEA